MKKEIILQGMGWGHMPEFMIVDELRSGRLLSIAGMNLRGGAGRIVAARRRDTPHGPVAKRLWDFIGEQAPALARIIEKRDFEPCEPDRSLFHQKAKLETENARSKNMTSLAGQ
jgi:hypothetical protein